MTDGIGHNAGIGHNGMTRDEWLFVILRSGQVTRISQHLALVIYHLSDPATNTAKLSARDLERITGWGRTAILEHLDELEIYIRVQWGQGRAKALFELQGVIADAVGALKSGSNGRVADATADTRTVVRDSVRVADTMPDTTADTTVVARQTDTTADTTADTNSCGRLADHKNDDQIPVVSASRTQDANGGDYRGGTKDSHQSRLHHHQGETRADAGASPRAFTIHEDGSFSGTAFEHFTAVDIAGFRQIYSHLDILAELVSADRFLAREFARDKTPFGAPERNDRLHMMLRKRNETAMALVTAQHEAIRQKALAGADESCWFDEDRLMVANGFRADLLKLVDGDEGRLRRTLDKVGGSVSIDLKGLALRKAVRAYFTRQTEWSDQDERKVRAYVRKVTPEKGDGKVETQAERFARMGREILDAKNGG